MLKRVSLFLLLIIIASLLIVGVALADYTYRAPLTISNNSTTTSYPMLPVSVNVNNTGLAANGFMQANALDTRVQNLGGLNYPWMVADNKTFTATVAPASSQVNLYFVTGESDAASMDIIPGYGGYFTVADNAALNHSANFSDSWSGYLDSTVAGGTVFKQDNATQTKINTSGNLTSAIMGGALDFEASNSDYVTINDDNAFTFAGAFSLTAWVKTESSPAIATIVSKFDFGAFTNREWSFSLNNGKPVLQLSTSGVADNSLTKTVTTNNVTIGVWTHVAMTYSGSGTLAGIKLYINGVYQDVTTNTTTGAYTGMNNRLNPVYLGATATGPAGFFDGLISGVEIYSAELSSSEIITDYQFGHRTSNLVAWWKLNDGAGNPSDSSGNGYNASGNLADWIATDGIIPKLELSTAVTGGITTIRPYADSANFKLDVNGVNVGSVALGGVTVPDVSSNYVVGSTATPYTSNFTMSIGGNLLASYTPVSMIIGTNLPNNATPGSYNGTITWGTNPAGVTVALGGLVSAGQPEVGSVGTTPSRDLLPSSGGTDLFTEPDISGSLATNPLRPFVQMISDTTTITELQAWRWMGIIFLVMAVAIAVKAVPRHLMVACVVAGIVTVALVVMTIWPLWALVLLVIYALGGLISERSPSL